MGIVFEQATAEALAAELTQARNALDGQSPGRRASVEAAMHEFAGAYAQLFWNAGLIESEDRRRLAGVLDDLSRQVRRSILAAKAEKQRQAEFSAWETRREQRQALGLLNPAETTLTVLYDPQPDSTPVPAPELSASFIPRPRNRTATGGGGERSSADPERLRSFARASRGANTALTNTVMRLQTVWAGFTASCSWVRMGATSFLPGFSLMLQENQQDADWAEHIAQAFERAGAAGILSGKALLNTDLNVLTQPENQLTGSALLRRLSELSAAGLAVLLAEHPDAFGTIRQLPPATVASWWANLNPKGGTGYSPEQTKLLGLAPSLFGLLDGMPALARVRANRSNAGTALQAATSELNELQALTVLRPGQPERITQLRHEIAYLQGVQTGTIQLYLYDRDASRIVEMIGTPSPDTRHVITYVPGTFTGLNDFYTGVTQQVPIYLVGTPDVPGAVPGAVAFVYKDGRFPGEQNTAAGPDFVRIGEASDSRFDRDTGRQLAAFETGMRADPLLGSRAQTSIGHSWGLANITSSEVAGTHYDKVISLAGAGMIPEWQPSPTTQYADLRYPDILTVGQLSQNPLTHAPAVYDGNTPIARREFQHMIYPTPDGTDLVAAHNLIASNTLDNKKAFEAMAGLVKR